MPSTQDTEQASKNSNHHNLVACLALYQHRQDQAVGIDWMSGNVRGLLWYYDQLQQMQLSQLMTAAYLNGIIQQGAEEIKELVAMAQAADNKLEILEQVQELEKAIKKAKKALNELKENNTET